MRRLGAVVVALACAASMWGAGAAAADPTPGPGVTLTEMGYWSGAIDDQMTVDAGGTAYASIGVGRATYRVRPAGGSWSTPRDLPGALPNTGVHLTAVKTGTAVAAYDGPTGYGQRYLAAHVRRTNGTWTTPYLWLSFAPIVAGLWLWQFAPGHPQRPAGKTDRLANQDEQEEDDDEALNEMTSCR